MILKVLECTAEEAEITIFADDKKQALIFSEILWENEIQASLAQLRWCYEECCKAWQR